MADIRGNDVRLWSLAVSVLNVMFGPIVWALNFAVIYGAHATLCAPGVLDPSRHEASIAWRVVFSTTLASTLVLSIAGVMFARRGMTAQVASRSLAEASLMRVQATFRRFLNGLAAILALLSLIGVLWWGVAVLIVDSCLQMR